MHGFRIFVSALFFPAALQAQPVEAGVFVTSQNTVEVSREAYRFDGAVLADTVDFPTRGIRMESVARYDADLSPESYELALYTDPGEAPVQQVNVRFSDTAAVWSTHTPLGDSTGVARLDGPYAFMQNLVFAHLAVILLQYDHARGGVQTVHVWMPEQAALMNMEIEFGSSTEGAVEIGGMTMNVEVDDGGWLRRATVPAQNVTVESRKRDSAGS